MNGRVAATTPGMATDAALSRGGRARWWRRRGSARAFWYETPDGARVAHAEHLARIAALALPPGWKRVLVSPSARSPLQAVGEDALGRLQYRYHPATVERRAREKFERIERFGLALPAIRAATNAHLALAGHPRERVLALVVRLMGDLCFRVGHPESERKFRTHGVTTLTRRHVDVRRGRLVFSYRGKSGVRHRRVLVDAELAALVQEVAALPGRRLFQYEAGERGVRPVTSRDVNEYLRAVTAGEFTTKDFRTWGGTLEAAVALAEIGPPASAADAKRGVARAMRRVADRLGNTPAVSRSAYVHPRVVERYGKGVTIDAYRPASERRLRRARAPAFEPEEVALLALLGVRVPSVSAQARARPRARRRRPTAPARAGRGGRSPTSKPRRGPTRSCPCRA